MKLLLMLAATGMGAVLFAAMHFAPVSADSGSASYSYLLGTDFLCEEGSLCWDIAKADNGDKVRILGSGTFSVHPKSATGEGTFFHTNAAGGMVATGTWKAVGVGLISFDSYGCGGAGLPDNACGGQAQIRVVLDPGAPGGPTLPAVLRVTCLIGQPPTGKHEGVRLNVQGLLNFNKEVSGETVFLKK